MIELIAHEEISLNRASTTSGEDLERKTKKMKEIKSLTRIFFIVLIPVIRGGTGGGIRYKEYFL